MRGERIVLLYFSGYHSSEQHWPKHQWGAACFGFFFVCLLVFSLAGVGGGGGGGCLFFIISNGVPSTVHVMLLLALFVKPLSGPCAFHYACLFKAQNTVDWLNVWQVCVDVAIQVEYPYTMFEQDFMNKGNSCCFTGCLSKDFMNKGNSCCFIGCIKTPQHSYGFRRLVTFGVPSFFVA